MRSVHKLFIVFAFLESCELFDENERASFSLNDIKYNAQAEAELSDDYLFLNIGADNYYGKPEISFRVNTPSEGYFPANGFTYSIIGCIINGIYSSSDDDFDNKSSITINKFDGFTISGTFYFEDPTGTIKVTNGEFTNIIIGQASANPGTGYYLLDGIPVYNSYAFAGYDTTNLLFDVWAGAMHINDIPLKIGTWEIKSDKPEDTSYGVWGVSYDVVYPPSQIRVESLDTIHRSIDVSFEIYYLLNGTYHSIKEGNAHAHY